MASRKYARVTTAMLVLSATIFVAGPIRDSLINWYTPNQHIVSGTCEETLVTIGQHNLNTYNSWANWLSRNCRSFERDVEKCHEIKLFIEQLYDGVKRNGLVDKAEARMNCRRIVQGFL